MLGFTTYCDAWHTADLECRVFLAERNGKQWQAIFGMPPASLCIPQEVNYDIFSLREFTSSLRFKNKWLPQTSYPSIPLSYSF